ncbi:hypothetical protein ACO0QE_002617 [Hanseniaspora vineae]
MLLAFCVAETETQLANSPLRGVSLENYKKLYQPLEIDGELKWRCLNNPEILLSYDQINDDYCDCPDGSDEPGTSACSDVRSKNPDSVQFFCENKGFQSYYIDSSKVDDGTCDCCDCSDELALSEDTTNNNCHSMNESFQKMINEEKEKHERGRAAFQNILSSTENHKNKEKYHILKQELANLDEQVKNLSSDVENLKMELNGSHDKTTQDPIAEKFEKIDLQNNVISPLKEYFASVGQVSKCYNSLDKLIKELSQNYNLYLNDPVVNDNMERYVELRDNLAQKENGLIVSVDFEEEQLGQLIKFYDEELFQLFVQKNFDLENIGSYKELLGKFSMAQAILAIKNHVYQTMIDVIKRDLSPIMEDIAENYHKNLKDQAVQKALTEFETFKKMYPAIPHGGKTLKISAQYNKSIQLLQDIILKHAAKMYQQHENGGSLDTFFYNNLLDNSLADFVKDSSLFKSLMDNVNVYKKKKLQTKYETANTNLTEMKELKAKMLEQFNYYKQFVDKKETESENVLAVLEKLDQGESSCVPGIVNKYEYRVCLGKPFQNGRRTKKHSIYQTGQDSFNLGTLVNFGFDKQTTAENYQANLRKARLGEILSRYFMSSSTKDDVSQLSSGNNGLILEYKYGQKCWKGPRRSAKVFFYCAEQFKVLRVFEASKCTYEIELQGPLGCSLDAF